MKVNNTSHRNRLNKTIFQDPNILFSKSHIKKNRMKLHVSTELILMSHLITNISRNVRTQG